MLNVVPTLRLARGELRLDRPRIMGVLNVTPDSFSDGGRYPDAAAAVDAALRMVEDGADLIDIGGESTRPGAQPVPPAEELARVIPVIEGLARQSPVPISVDTSQPEVMRAAVAAGAVLINDVRALRLPGALDAAAETGAAVCLMHMQGTPEQMQDAPHYEDVLDEVQRFLADRILACQFAGIDQRRLLADPGFGFGKRLEHNLALLGGLRRLESLRVPLLVGLSRKSMLGQIGGQTDPLARVHASVAAALWAVEQGAAIVRVHDVAATRDALAVWTAVQPYRPRSNPTSRPPAHRSDDDPF